MLKQQLRKLALEYRNNLSKSGMSSINSSKIVNKILSSSDFINSTHIAIYMPIKGEVDLTPLLSAEGKYFYIPKCVNNNLEFGLFDKNNLIRGQFNIIEYTGKSINPDILDLVYIPCLMANKSGYRLGYGRGFYDRFFNQYNLKAKKIIVTYNDLISDEFVQDEYDYKCDCVISEV